VKLHILGCHAATPRSTTNPTAQVLESRNQLFLIDCGEGTQVQLRRHKLKFSRIDHIFISHLHGDHFFGLPGLLATFRLMGREKDLHLFGPEGIKEAITIILRLGEAETGYTIHFHELKGSDSECILDSEKISVHTIPLDHRIYTNGFLFRQKPKLLNLKIEVIEQYGIDTAQFLNIKRGSDARLKDGKVIPNSELTLPPPKQKSYAFCSDTAYNDRILPFIKEVDTLYHDATFLESESHLTAITKHATAREAATLAREAKVERLILGHFSSRYKDLHAFLEESRPIFSQTFLAEDGAVFEW